MDHSCWPITIHKIESCDWLNNDEGNTEKIQIIGGWDITKMFTIFYIFLFIKNVLNSLNSPVKGSQ